MAPLLKKVGRDLGSSFIVATCASGARVGGGGAIVGGGGAIVGVGGARASGGAPFLALLVLGV